MSSHDPHIGPRRIQRRRTKGWRTPEGAIYVGRPTQWANPYLVGSRRLWGGGRGDCHIVTLQEGLPGIPDDHDHLTLADAHAVATRAYRAWITSLGPAYLGALPLVLGGRDLMCWCPLELDCHADVLLDLANPTTGVDPAHAHAGATVPSPQPNRTVRQ